MLMPAECKRAGCVRQGRECWLNGLVSWSWVSVLCPLIAPRASLLWVPVIPCSRNVRPNPRSANLCAVSKALRRRRRPPASDRAAKFGVNSVFAGNFALRRVSSRLPTPPTTLEFREHRGVGAKNAGISATLRFDSKVERQPTSQVGAQIAIYLSGPISNLGLFRQRPVGGACVVIVQATRTGQTARVARSSAAGSSS